MSPLTEIRLLYYKRRFLYWVTLPHKFIRNYFLVKKYPFLRPNCGWGISMEYLRDGYKYRYEETWLDCLPCGWRKAFGKQLCEDLKREIENSNLTDYKVEQVKEKWGILTWYDDGGNEYTDEIIRKYEKLSAQICQKCGKKAEYVTLGWIGYYCGDCVKKMNPNNYKPIKEEESSGWVDISVDDLLEDMQQTLLLKNWAEYYGYIFEMISQACPEQYDVYKDGKYVAYIRKRYGHLNAHFIKDDGEIDWENAFYSVNEGDSYSGTIENKKVHFKAITDLITEHLKGK